MRRLDKDPWRKHAVELLTREAEVLELLAGTDVPAPRLVAVDPPALLMTRLPGALVLDRPMLEPLASMLVKIHGVAARPRDYQSWAAGKTVPEWGDTALWERAIAALAEPPPPFAGCFLHRDFHPGNVLFEDGQVSGVVDWVETSWGPPDLDVAHCGTNLAMLHGADAAEGFRDAYVAAGGRLSASRYWTLLDAVGFLPDPVKVVGAWRAAGRDISEALARERLEAHVELSLRTLSSRG